MKAGLTGFQAGQTGLARVQVGFDFPSGFREIYESYRGKTSPPFIYKGSWPIETTNPIEQNLFLPFFTLTLAFPTLVAVLLSSRRRLKAF